MNSAPPPLLTLYCDGSCPVCTREIGFYCAGAALLRLAGRVAALPGIVQRLEWG